MTEKRTTTRRNAIRTGLAAATAVGVAGCSNIPGLGGSSQAEVSRENPREIRVGQTIHANLQTTDGRDPIYDDVAEPLELQLSERTSLSISMSAANFDTYIVVTQGGATVVEDDDGGSGTNSDLLTELDAGTYTVWAGSFSGDATGDYTIAVSEAGSPAGGGGDQGGSAGGGGAAGEQIQVGQTVQDQITTDAARDPVYDDLADPYQFTLDSRTTVRISLSSEAFDAYLLVTQNGETVAENDDASGLDSEVTTTLEPGTYRIWAGSISGQGTGAYTLQVQQAG